MFPMSADAQVERRLLKRKLTVWRILGIASFALLLVAWLFPFVPSTPIGGGDGHIARLSIEGVIFTTDAQRDILAGIAEDDEAHALLLHINSPGGTTSGSETLFNAVREVADHKPVAVILEDVAASGGYLVAIGGDRIFARRNTITGSIGVVLQWLQAEELFDNIGVRAHSVASGPLKGEPSIFSAPKEATLEAARDNVEDAFSWFVELIMERRDLEREEVLRLADGRIYTGGQALEVALIDQIGEERDAIEWLESAHDIPPDLEVLDWSPRPWEEIWNTRSGGGLLRLLGGWLPGGGEIALTGLVSMWHPGV